MLAKVCVGLLATAALAYGGAALYVGGCPFSACCHSSCGGTQTESTCPQANPSPCCPQTETSCCETPGATCAAVSVCGSAVPCDATCPAATGATTHD
jgi:hypothetical protein